MTGGQTRNPIDPEPLWYKDAVIYELHVRSLFDSNADGIGDFAGLTEKLPYLQDLGVTAIWILPFYPSPLRDDGYDIADYRSVHETYGNLRDFKRFLREAHDRGLRVITELVINHTSDQHRWFQRARRPHGDNRLRDFYVWSDTPEKYQEARIIFGDFETSNWSWDPVANRYYWHRFYSHQPDLNFDNPEVHQAIIKVMDHWLDMGVDGLRLDAIPYLYEREGTNCENLPETHRFLKELRSHLDANYSDRMFLAEANQWPEDAVEYFGDGDECHMAFHFPLMPRLFMALQMEDRFPIIDIIEQTPPIPDVAQWAIFLRNHDELTLEMVTDEERDYMYQVYAKDQRARINLGIRRRLAPLLGNDRRKIELMKGLLMALPGTPVIYYGDEIGMGDNIYLGDRNGVRTPMQWSSDRNAGFSRANPQQLNLPVIIDPEYHYETVNVEAQQNNPHSLLWWTKRLIALRKRYRAFSRGSLTFLHPENRRVLAFLRTYQDEQLLLLFNLSRFTQYVELDLSSLNGLIPVELFGRERFPTIGELPYFLTLGPHNFYWFELQPQDVVGAPVELAELEGNIPQLEKPGQWPALLKTRARHRLAELLPRYLSLQRWSAGNVRTLREVSIEDVIEVPSRQLQAHLCLLQTTFWRGREQTYAVPIGRTGSDLMQDVVRHSPQEAIAYLPDSDDGQRTLLSDVGRRGEFLGAVLDAISRKRKWPGTSGRVEGVLSGSQPEFSDRSWEGFDFRLQRVEDSYTALVIDEELVLKFYRRVERGLNPEWEILRFLQEHEFEGVPDVFGALEWHSGRAAPATLMVVEELVPNEGDAWSYTLDAVGRFYESVLALEREDGPRLPEKMIGTLQERVGRDPQPEVLELAEPYLATASDLGVAAARLHAALTSDEELPQFRPEPLTRLRQRSIQQSMRIAAKSTLAKLEQQLPGVPENAIDLARQLVAREDEILSLISQLSSDPINCALMRCHGDLHLGRVLHTGRGFVITDFEGEQDRSIGERRIKRTAIRDVASMIRSFHAAAYASMIPQGAGSAVRADDLAALEPWADAWASEASVAFLGAYLEAADGRRFVPDSDAGLSVLLTTCLIDRAMYELDYNLSNRVEWVIIPVRGILSLLDTPALGS